MLRREPVLDRYEDHPQQIDEVDHAVQPAESIAEHHPAGVHEKDAGATARRAFVTKDGRCERVSPVSLEDPVLAANASSTDQSVQGGAGVGHAHEIDQLAGHGRREHPAHDCQAGAQFRVEGGAVHPCLQACAFDDP